MSGRALESPVPGQRLIAIPPLIAAGAIAFNAFYLRRFHAGLLSGKLSDLGINFFLPVLLVAIGEWLKFGICVVRKRPFRPLGKRAAVVATVLSAGYFAALKVIPVFTAWHIALLRVLALPFPVSTNFRNLTDPTDLITLIVAPLALAYLCGRKAETQLALPPRRSRVCARDEEPTRWPKT